MSLDQAPEPTLRDMKGMLETIQDEWMLTTTLEKRKELNEQFKALAEQIKQKYGTEGKKMVDAVVAKHMQLQRPR